MSSGKNDALCSTRRRRGRSAGTPFVPTTSGGHGAQGRSSDETAWRRARQRASLDRSEHRGTSPSRRQLARPDSVPVADIGMLGVGTSSLEFPASGGHRHSELHGVMREASVSVMRHRPHHLISGSVAFDRDHNPAFCGYEAGAVGPIFHSGNQPRLATVTHRPATHGVRCTARRRRSGRLGRGHDSSFRNQTGGEIPPERDHQLPRQCHDGDTSDAPLGVADALQEPLGQGAARLMTDP